MKTLQKRIDAIREEFQDHRPDVVMVLDELVEESEELARQLNNAVGRCLILSEKKES